MNGNGYAITSIHRTKTVQDIQFATEWPIKGEKSWVHSDELKKIKFFTSMELVADGITKEVDEMDEYNTVHSDLSRIRFLREASVKEISRLGKKESPHGFFEDTAAALSVSMSGWKLQEEDSKENKNLYGALGL